MSQHEACDDRLVICSPMADEEPARVDVDTAAIFASLYREHGCTIAKAISRAEREANGYPSTTLTYGEIDFEPFRSLLELLKTNHDVLTKPGGTFLDVGCGTGRPLFAAALLHDFDAVVGYEILATLASTAQTIHGLWQHEKKALNALKKRTRFVIGHEDATQVEWPIADVIFCNATCFDERLMLLLTKQALLYLKKGGVIMTATKQLCLDDDHAPVLGLVQKFKMQQSWGMSTVYIYKRVG
ncbi:hypothetical protein SDRG_08958 [Saprolegnia diclina VS20]|uniref:Histone-lysine N-methyltransferase, H3 lysine-79 specific n=1 Tax=Saprolegnia diclina (strain VS20) TaxID=1156394 RepID=T0Q6I3_SAPDV|nr:hypothetical protein SDRG_08958 [Saprolegnia diclina VS20]EQC33444.1 hypothetical protein SDRG_08958 [Saprolegnia diclina VS20]|eukprot:XP_008613084.1 hypothetical protein SDRG_08958 [Saprolegnia diclina VS20]